MQPRVLVSRGIDQPTGQCVPGWCVGWCRQRQCQLQWRVLCRPRMSSSFHVPDAATLWRPGVLLSRGRECPGTCRRRVRLACWPCGCGVCVCVCGYAWLYVAACGCAWLCMALCVSVCGMPSASQHDAMHGQVLHDTHRCAREPSHLPGRVQHWAVLPWRRTQLRLPRWAVSDALLPLTWPYNSPGYLADTAVPRVSPTPAVAGGVRKATFVLRAAQHRRCSSFRSVGCLDTSQGHQTAPPVTTVVAITVATTRRVVIHRQRMKPTPPPHSRSYLVSC